MGYTIPLMLALARVGGFDAQFVALFTPLEYRYTGGDYQDELFRYRLFIPAGATKDQRMPLVVWLHGRGEAGQENLDHLLWLEHLVFKPPWQRERFAFFLLAVQCPVDNGLWRRHGVGRGDDMIHVVKAILDKTLAEHPIDVDRVCLAGVSSGGSGTWDMAARYPEYFAAVAPMASRGADAASLDRLAKIPVWAFHCTRDPGAPIAPVRHSVDALRSAGGIAHLTEIDAATHDCWTPAFAEYRLLDWLLAQQRHAASPLPGAVSLSGRVRNVVEKWQWWQALLQLMLPVAVVALLVWVARERRQQRARRGLPTTPSVSP
jgi:predicted peptidase